MYPNQYLCTCSNKCAVPIRPGLRTQCRGNGNFTVAFPAEDGLRREQEEEKSTSERLCCQSCPSASFTSELLPSASHRILCGLAFDLAGKENIERLRGVGLLSLRSTDRCEAISSLSQDKQEIFARFPLGVVCRQCQQQKRSCSIACSAQLGAHTRACVSIAAAEGTAGRAGNSVSQAQVSSRQLKGFAVSEVLLTLQVMLSAAGTYLSMFC